MINALFSSKTCGTKHFQRVGKPKFGWDAIDSLYKREVSRAQLNCAKMVPRLKETHCLRDAWTKLNVLPAKIMQVNIMYLICRWLLLMVQCILIARTSIGRASLVYAS